MKHKFFVKAENGAKEAVESVTVGDLFTLDFGSSDLRAQFDDWVIDEAKEIRYRRNPGLREKVADRNREIAKTRTRSGRKKRNGIVPGEGGSE